MSKFTDFQAIKLELASPDEILSWSHGEVLKPETINYRTQKPEKDGLFCERIFGPVKDFECACGKYKRIRYKGIVCDRCGVEVTSSSVRRERMGHINLSSPVAHVWFLRSMPSRIGLILNISQRNLEKVIYFVSYLVTEVNEAEKEKELAELKLEYQKKKKELKDDSKELSKAEDKYESLIISLKSLRPGEILTENEYYDLSLRYAHVFKAGIGAGAVRKVLEKIDLNLLEKELKKELEKAKAEQSRKIKERLVLIKKMISAKIRPEWMILTVLPVLPPELRPMVALDGSRYASSDINDLYRRIINRNNRLKKLIELNAPEVICRNERRMLQEAVDALIDNTSRFGRGPVMATTGARRQLKSLADSLKGKKGRLRRNLLGKRVDYSGRSVIVVGPKLKLNECGVPKKMALELFKPFVIRKLIENEVVHNVKIAGRLIEQETDEVWAALEEVIQDKYVLLNRAPTLHRLSIESFKPVLVEGLALQLHPLACKAFNADFDGDQMAIHLPLGKKAQWEAKNIMLASKNLLKPASGKPIRVPSQDMILGCYWVTVITNEDKVKAKKIFANCNEAVLAHDNNKIDIREKIKVRLESGEIIETSVGRILFNQILPKEIGFVNEPMSKKPLMKLVSKIVEKCDNPTAVDALDKIKEFGFTYATCSGVSWGIDDLNIPKKKDEIVKETEALVEKIHQKYTDGYLTREEEKQYVIEKWLEAVEKINETTIKELDKTKSAYTIVSSGARGSWGQVTQMAGTKGLVVNPAGEIIELPVKSSFKEGFNVLEFFISTHGSRKGLTDTALRTSSAGYLTRRLVDVAQDIVVREEDCGTNQGLYIWRKDGEEVKHSLADRIIGRYILETIKDKKGKVIIKKGEIVDRDKAEKIDQLGLEKVLVRSPITCQSKHGICQKCYGWNLGNNKIVNLGEAVGIVTAQAIGEPGTQLTLRTFHTGGVAGGGDITQGLPRVEEIFEARVPHGKASISEINGQISDIVEENNKLIVRIIPNNEDEIKRVSNGRVKKGKNPIIEYVFLKSTNLIVEKGDLITRGQKLSDGSLDLNEIYQTMGKEKVIRYIVSEIQKIYSAQGEGINDKYIELIIRQMFSRIRIKQANDTNLLEGDVVERRKFNEENERVKTIGKKPAVGEELILGMSRVSL
ncbi:MAG TPA: DNA-directed RNA polymerase subunit beta', partial [Candidatus Portnoybacteria bacterium]|nr:DNA-directed RNA polymerase subunit beta' [Candidatus Portnoybacteria bacterium]